MVQIKLNLFGVIRGLYSPCLMVLVSLLLTDDKAGALPAGGGRRVCRGLPANLQPDTAAGVDGVRAEGHIHLRRIQLKSYTPGQHVIVSVLETSSDKEEQQSNPQVKRYALQAISDATGEAVGRFKAVSDATRLHHCGKWTVLHERRQSGVSFSWLPPQEGAVQPVVITVAKV
ncbi:uncharacterized protein LOC110985568 [Acanthaster planci]|uniref:Uncharacterized protein LOC110985568 n=1 Tax=Acanthaster planci TaxID=133434 RepID=A0A8B7ZC12_ACAPL|nr:uncharacterized protein LOC110985568 [Acanthaster planci]